MKNENETRIVDADSTKEYTKPVISDYGSLQDLTAAGGGKFNDIPIGAPVGISGTSTP